MWVGVRSRDSRREVDDGEYVPEGGGGHRPVCESFGLHVSVIIPLMLHVHSSIIRLINNVPGKAEDPGDHFPTQRIKINRNQQGAQRTKWKMQAEDINSKEKNPFLRRQY